MSDLVKDLVETVVASTQQPEPVLRAVANLLRDVAGSDHPPKSAGDYADEIESWSATDNSDNGQPAADPNPSEQPQGDNPGY